MKLTRLGEFLWRAFRFKKNYCDESDTKCLFVRFLSACPNKCKFCFDASCAKLDHLVSGPELAEKVIASGRKSLMISGGEPCLDMSRLEAFVDALPEDIEIESLMTSLPKTAFDQRDILDKVIKRCKIVDISSHGISDSADERVYGIKLGYCKQKFIEELAKKWPDKVYVSCVMLASRFVSLDDIRKRIDHYTRIGVRNFYLNEIGNNDPFQRADDYISIKTLYARSNEKFRFGDAFSDGCKIDISSTFHDDYPDVVVKCRRRCFRCGSGDDLSWRDVIKQWVQAKMIAEPKIATPVLHGDGKMTAWFTEVDYIKEEQDK